MFKTCHCFEKLSNHSVNINHTVIFLGKTELLLTVITYFPLVRVDLTNKYVAEISFVDLHNGINSPNDSIDNY